MRRTCSLLLLALSLAPLFGCAGFWRSHDLAPSGLTRSEERFRLAIASGKLDSAGVQRALTGDDAPGDELMRALYGGVSAFYAGRYRESGALLDVASALADDRVTKSVSRSALALVTNDRALPYEPSRTERLLIPYYGALAHLRLADTTGALVEARRLAGLLEQHGEALAQDERRLHGTLRYFTGALFEAAGERNDAAVAYRNAAPFDTTSPVIPRDSGDVVVVVEQGFVAHRVEESLTVLLASGELHGLRDGDPDHRFGFGRLLADRVLQSAVVDGELRSGPLHVPTPLQPLVAFNDRDRCKDSDAPSIVTVLRPDSSGKPARAVANRSDRCRDDDDDDEDDDAPYLLRVAWPNYRWTSRAPASAVVLAAGRDTAATAAFADVSSAVVHDFQRELPLVIARTLVRGAAKAALTKGAEKKLEEKNEALGKLVGVLGNVGNVLLERADTRSWHLLPGAIGVARLRLAPGEHTVHVQLPDGRQAVIERVVVAPGRLGVVHARAF